MNIKRQMTPLKEAVKMEDIFLVLTLVAQLEKNVETDVQNQAQNSGYTSV